jgi:hypothetical protein
MRAHRALLQTTGLSLPQLTFFFPDVQCLVVTLSNCCVEYHWRKKSSYMYKGRQKWLKNKTYMCMEYYMTYKMPTAGISILFTYYNCDKQHTVITKTAVKPLVLIWYDLILFQKFINIILLSKAEITLIG